MTDKQFNYILRRLRADIMRSIYDKAFHAKDDSVYVDGTMIVCLEDVNTSLNIYFEELIEND